MSGQSIRYAAQQSLQKQTQTPAKSNIKKPTLTVMKDLLQMDAVKKRFEEILGKKAAGFTASITSLVGTSTNFEGTDANTILSSAFIAATLDLPINQNLGFKVANFQLGYKGYIQLAMRTGQYRTINTAEVFKGEIKKINRFTGEIEFNEDAEIGGDVVGYLAYFKLINGFEKYFYMSKAEMLIHAKRFSKMYSKKESKLTGIWAEDFDTMSKKTVLKLLLSKYGILSIELQTALQSDQAVVTTDEKSGEIHYEFVENEEDKPEAIPEEKIEAPVNEEAEITAAEIIKRIKEIKSKFELTAWTKKHSAEIEQFTNGEFVDIQNALEEKEKEFK